MRVDVVGQNKRNMYRHIHIGKTLPDKNNQIANNDD
jgi:hypothetical protein